MALGCHDSMVSMRKLSRTFGLALLVVVPGVAVAQAPAKAPRIFREIAFQPFAPIVLGQPLPERAPRTITSRAGRAALALRGFGDTDSIYVDSNSDLTVRGLEFVYPRTKDIPASIAEYERSLGSGQHAATDSVGQRLERWTWRDSDTVFQFAVLRSSQAVARIWSSLTDLRHP
jgi:hypothetical protein